MGDETNRLTNLAAVAIDGNPRSGVALFDMQDNVWLSFDRPWWDLSSWLWWWLTPGRELFMVVSRESGGYELVRGKRIATRVRRKRG